MGRVIAFVHSPCASLSHLSVQDSLIWLSSCSFFPFLASELSPNISWWLVHSPSSLSRFLLYLLLQRPSSCSLPTRTLPSHVLMEFSQSVVNISLSDWVNIYISQTLTKGVISELYIWILGSSSLWVTASLSPLNKLLFPPFSRLPYCFVQWPCDLCSLWDFSVS